jgi:Zn-dependent protease
MFEAKEISWIIIALIVFEFVILFPFPSSLNPFLLLTPVLILSVNLISKKIAASKFSIKIKYKIWEFERYSLHEHSHLKKPFPIGLVFPVLLSFLSMGVMRVFLFLQFDAENIAKKRILKKRGINQRTEINESDLAFASFWGFFSLIILAIIGSFSVIEPFFPFLSKYAVFYGIWNLLPISELDGSKLFFGSMILWILTAIMYAVALILVLV